MGKLPKSDNPKSESSPEILIYLEAWPVHHPGPIEAYKPEYFFVTEEEYRAWLESLELA